MEEKPEGSKRWRGHWGGWKRGGVVRVMGLLMGGEKGLTGEVGRGHQRSTTLPKGLPGPGGE